MNAKKIFWFDVVYVPFINIKVAKIATPFWTDRVQGEWWLINVCVVTQVTKLCAYLTFDWKWCWSQEHEPNFTSGGFGLFVLRHHHISASLYSFFCTRSVREGVGDFWQLLTLNYGTKIRSNKKKLLFFLGRSKYLELTKSAKGL